MRGSMARGWAAPTVVTQGSRRRATSSTLRAEPKRNLVMATVDDWIDACRRQGIVLRRRGQEHCGPCPICQTGDDRFWIEPGRVQPVLARCRHGHTYRELHRALLGDSFDTPVRPRRRRPAAAPAELGDPTLSDQAHRARRLFAAAHRGQPTYFRRKFPRIRSARLDARRHVARAAEALRRRATASWYRRRSVHHYPTAPSGFSATCGSPDSRRRPAGARRDRSCSRRA